MSIAADWITALTAPENGPPPGLTSWNGSDPGNRFGIYRNNVILSLVDALADTFPVTQALVGTDFFRAMARLFAIAHPPKSPVMAFYGVEFPGFIAAFPPAGTLPYLPDVAQLEMAYVQAFHAADAVPLAPDAIVAMLAEPAVLSGARAGLHPSLIVLKSAYPVVSIWAAHQDQNEPSTTVLSDPENAWVLRNGLTVAILPMPDGDCDFISQIRRGVPILDAANKTLEKYPDFELAACLSVLIRENAIIDLSV